jgi:alcohol dehydrogenase
MGQIEYVGPGSIRRVADIIATHRPRSIFLVTGKKSYRASGGEASIEPLLSGIAVTRYNDLRELTSADDIERGSAAYKRCAPDLVIAIGGGHILDAAKAINASVGPAPMVAIPTTAGSGAESTPFAVVYKDGRKTSIEGKALLPAYAIVDSALAVAVPPRVALASALDALAQSIESYWSLRATEESRGLSREALELIWGSIRGALRGDIHKLEKLARGAHCAGKAIAIAKTTVCHALSYSLTFRFGVPHGIAVTSTLPAAMRYNSFSIDQISAESIEKLARDLKVPRLAEFGVTLADIPSLCAEVNLERLANNPKLLSPDDLIAFYTYALS